MHKNFNTIWTADKRYELVAQVLAGNSCREVAFSNGINPGQLYQWIQKYKTRGYNGLVDIKKRSTKQGASNGKKYNPNTSD